MVAAALGVAVHFDAPLCPVALITHHPCPGCGLTRASIALLQGHFAEAAHLHPLVFVALPVVALATTRMVYVYVRDGRFDELRLPGGLTSQLAAIALFALVVGVWVARFFGAFGGPAPV